MFRLGSCAAVTCVLFCLLAVSAGAATYCVNDSACPSGGITKATAQAALTAANAATDADTVRLGAGSYTGPFIAKEGTTIQGAGTAGTTLSGADVVTHAVVELDDGAAANALTVVSAGGFGVFVQGAPASLDGVVVDGSVGGGSGVSAVPGLDAHDLTISGAVSGVLGGDVSLTDTAVHSTNGVQLLTGDNTLDHVAVDGGPNGVNLTEGTLDANTVSVAVEGQYATGVFVGGGGTADLEHVTLAGTGADSNGIIAIANCTDDAAVDGTEVAVGGFTHALDLLGHQGFSDGACADDTTAEVDLDHSAFDATSVTKSGPTASTVTDSIDTTALGLDPNLVPKANSPLLDAGVPGEADGTDVRGLPRPVDGNGDSVARADIGAVERQPGDVNAPDPTPAPTPADHTVYCVDYASCPSGGVTEPTPKAALDASATAPTASQVYLGAGTFDGPLIVPSVTELIGSGRGQTIITGGLGVVGMAHDLTVKLTDAEPDGLAGGGRSSADPSLIDRVDVDGSALTVPATGVVGGLARLNLHHSTITMAKGIGISGGDGTFEDVTITAPVGVQERDYPLTLHRVTIHANTGILDQGGPVTGDAVTIIGTGDDPVGVNVQPNGGPPAGGVGLTHLTLSGPADGTAVRIAPACHGTGDANLTEAAFSGWATQIDRHGLEASDCTGGDTAQANVTLDHSAYDPAKVTQAGPGALTESASLKLADVGLNGDLVPGPGSPLIDAGVPGEATATDVRGYARPVDGDGDGTATADIGAAERQTPASPTPTPTPTTTPTATPDPTVTPTPTPSTTPDPTPTPTVTPSPTPTGTPAPDRPRPRKVRLVLEHSGHRTWTGTATVVLRYGQTVADCSGASAKFQYKPRGHAEGAFDDQCTTTGKIAVLTSIKLRRVRVRACFGGSATLRSRCSPWERLPRG